MARTAEAGNAVTEKPKLTLVRTFDAPVEAVWRAWTEPEALKRGFGPDAGEVIAVPTVATVPLTKAWYLGIANIRGNLYSVIDFGVFLGHEAEAPLPGAAQARLVLFGPRVGELRAGLVVHKVLGLRNLAELAKGDAATDAPGWYGARWTDRDGGAWQEIDLALLAQDPGFLQVGV